MSKDPAAMKEEDEDKKSAPQGSPKPEEPPPPPQQSSPTMQSAPAHPQAQQQHYFVAPNGQHQPAADYRASPTGPAAMSLPSIQHFEGGPMQHPQPPYMPTAHLNGAQHLMQAPYHPNLVQYQTQPMPPTMPSNAPSGHNGMMRYPLPPQAPLDTRQMSGGRHKKEIKRRTKTGCLTCRKRRIKCDEQHPTCRNCTKSKRECLGYDPVFRAAPSPANIQPAPATGAPPPKPTVSHQAPPNQYQPYPGTVASFPPQPEAEGQVLGPQDSPNTYHNPLDPALSGRHPDIPDMAPSSYVTKIEPFRRVRKLNIEELFTLDDAPSAYQLREPIELSPQSLKDIDSFYRLHYAPGLDRLLETTWYSTQGPSVLNGDSELQDLTLQCMEQMQSTTSDYAQTESISSLEARFIWTLAHMPRSQTAADLGIVLYDPLAKELESRVAVLEALLTGSYLPPDSQPPPQPSPVANPNEDANRKYNQEAFWYHLGVFATLNDEDTTPKNPSTEALMTSTLASLRVLLNMLENRDVLYSIAIARHVGGRLPDWSPRRGNPIPPPPGTDPDDDIAKLGVAVEFVRAEELKGTNQVVQRVCGMALRGWVLQKS